MDINFYLAREQFERFLAAAATTPQGRAAHQQLATQCRDLIDGQRARAARFAAPPVKPEFILSRRALG